DSEAEFRTWLTTVVRACRRRRRTALEHSRHQVLTAVVPDSFDERDGPEDLAVLRAEYGRVWYAFGRLSAQHRDVLDMRFLRGLAVAEIAERWGRPASSVRAVQFHALRRLRRLVGSGVLDRLR
ncbi:RNA polymerase sigma factor, partial [Kibdelosporangium lantanae]